jgi:hypothetical protein
MNKISAYLSDLAEFEWQEIINDLATCRIDLRVRIGSVAIGASPDIFGKSKLVIRSIADNCKISAIKAIRDTVPSFHDVDFEWNDWSLRGTKNFIDNVEARGPQVLAIGTVDNLIKLKDLIKDKCVHMTIGIETDAFKFKDSE